MRGGGHRDTVVRMHFRAALSGRSRPNTRLDACVSPSARSWRDPSMARRIRPVMLSTTGIPVSVEHDKLKR